MSTLESLSGLMSCKRPQQQFKSRTALLSGFPLLDTQGQDFSSLLVTCIGSGLLSSMI